MKTCFRFLAFPLSAFLFAGCAGCTYTGKQTPLQPGDAIIFKLDGLRRAQEFRHDSGNDPGLTNRVVNITVPTTVITP